jgi:hypothetical protein
MSEHRGSAGSRVFEVCLMALLSAMALYGAVHIILVIWIPLCIGLTILAAAAIMVALFRWRIGRF